MTSRWPISAVQVEAATAEAMGVPSLQQDLDAKELSLAELDDSIATVEGEIITASAFERAYGDYLERYRSVTGQQWDLEGFFLSGSELTMVGGFDFENGEYASGHTYLAGDIFIMVALFFEYLDFILCGRGTAFGIAMIKTDAHGDP